MTLHDAVAAFLRREVPRLAHLVVAVSGGADSTALLLIVAELPGRDFTITAAHVNHQLRGIESDADEQFVVDLARRLGVGSVVRRAIVEPGEIRRVGLEAAARTVRYAALRSIAADVGADQIATAHHRDDQAETVLMRLVTGAGLTRLRGIEPASRGIIRPLLHATRRELEQFVTSRGIEPRNDAMNSDPRFLRTTIRAEILPRLRQINPQIDATLAETAEQAGELDRELDLLLSRVQVERDDGRSVIPRRDFDALPMLFRRLILHEIRRLDPTARDVGADDLRRIAAARGRLSVTGIIEAVGDDATLTLARRESAAAPRPFVHDVEIGKPCEIAELGVTIEITPLDPAGREPAYHGESFQLFDVDEPVPHLFQVRSRREGDRFQPLGLAFEKSLKDFLIDRKIPVETRDRLPLLTCNGRIVWIAGVEVSERFKIRGGAVARYRATLRSDEGTLRQGTDRAKNR